MCRADGVDIDLGELSYTGDRAGFIGTNLEIVWNSSNQDVLNGA